MEKKILVAVAWPYVNGPMHIGHLAGAYIAADIFARFHRLNGDKVLMVSGSDMHGTPTAVIAEQEGVAPIEVAERFHKRMSDTLKSIDVSFDLYTKTSTQNHKEVSQEIFLTLLKNGYVFKEKMMQAYCPHDNRFLPDRFVEGVCPYCKNPKARGDQCDSCGRTLDPKDLLDPKCKFCKNPPVEKETEHYFLDLPQFSQKLYDYISSKDYWRANVRSFPLSWLKEGLKARPITRDMNYGIPVPVKGYENKVLYVWFEAVIGYLSASIEWAKLTGGSWEEFWKDNKSAFHYYFMGKDNIPFHTIIWPAMLMGYNLELNLPYNVVSNENLTLEGEKFSKSTGNYIEADYIIQKYGSDQVRYYISSIMPETSDTDFSWKNFVDSINNELVANFGNLVNRTVTFIERYYDGKVPEGKLDKDVEKAIKDSFAKTSDFLEQARFQQGLAAIMELSKFGNKYFDNQKPWVSPKESTNTLFNVIQIISALRTLLNPYLPKTSHNLEKLLDLQQAEKWEYTPVKVGTNLTSVGLLFAKIDEKVIPEEKALMLAPK